LLSDSLEKDDASRGFFKNPSFRLVLGAVTAVIGVLKFLSVVPGNYPVIGDIVPAFGGLLSGAALIYGFYKAYSTINSPSADKVLVFMNIHQKIIGGISITTAVLHFLFPTALFL
jgi:hypothetical protein